MRNRTERGNGGAELCMRILFHRKNRETMFCGSVCMMYVCTRRCTYRTCTHSVCTFMYCTSIHAACTPYVKFIREKRRIQLDPKGSMEEKRIETSCSMRDTSLYLRGVINHFNPSVWPIASSFEASKTAHTSSPCAPGCELKSSWISLGSTAMSAVEISHSDHVRN